MLKNWYWLIGIAYPFSKDPETVEMNCSRVFLVILLVKPSFPESILSSEVIEKTSPSLPSLGLSPVHKFRFWLCSVHSCSFCFFFLICFHSVKPVLFPRVLHILFLLTNHPYSCSQILSILKSCELITSCHSTGWIATILSNVCFWIKRRIKL